MRSKNQIPSTSIVQQEYSLRPGAEEFPLQVVLGITYPCNLGCPFCPYTDGNSDLRKYYRDRKGDLLPFSLFKKIADEAAPYRAFIRCTGGGEPTLHPQLFDMIEYAKKVGARVWLTTNGTLLGPHEPKTKKNLDRLIDCECDVIEFSVDASDAATYDIVRPPKSGSKAHPERWNHLVEGIRYAIDRRNRQQSKTRIICSAIMHEHIEGKVEALTNFWMEQVGIDELIKRKYLTWDDNTTLNLDKSADPILYAHIHDDSRPPLKPCVWPFERLNIDTLGQVALCGQDISFKTAEQFGNANDVSIKDIWQGAAFKKYREMHLSGRGESISPCSNCSAWKAGIRSWDHGWLKVMDTAEKHRQKILKLNDADEIGVETEVVQRKKSD